MTTMTSRDFNQHTSAAKRWASEGPVFVTDRGRPQHVLLTYQHYQDLARGHRSLADAFSAMPDTADLAVDFPRATEPPRAAVFD